MVCRIDEINTAKMQPRNTLSGYLAPFCLKSAFYKLLIYKGS
jgi:hypothetical protein